MNKYIFFLLAYLFFVSPAYAATINVTTNLDQNGPATDCNAGGLDCSLREAIAKANSTVQPDHINLPSNLGNYNISLGEMLITTPVSIRSADANKAVITISRIDRLFNINFDNFMAGAQKGISLTKLTIDNFALSAIKIESTLSNAITIDISDVIFQNNYQAFNGSALSINQTSTTPGTLNLTNVFFNNNRGWALGGALYLKGMNASLNNVEFNNNTHETYPTYRYGSAMYAEACPQISIINSKFISNGNYATMNGGAIYLDSSNIFVNKTLFKGNIAVSGGGGLYMTIGHGPTNYTATLNSSSFYQNRTSGGGSAIEIFDRFWDTDGKRLNLNLVNSSIIDNRSNFDSRIGGLSLNGLNQARISYSTITENKNDSDYNIGLLAYFINNIQIQSSVLNNNIQETTPINECEFLGVTTAESLGFNALDSSCPFINSTANADLIDTALGFASLAETSNSVGYTLLLDSPLLDAATTTCNSLPDTFTGIAYNLNKDILDNSRKIADACDIGSVEYQCSPLSFYPDADGDSFGTGDALLSCLGSLEGYALNNNDCDDTNIQQLTTDSAELCDGADNNCNGVIDEGFTDTNSDGTPDCREIEICDGVDNNTNGNIDEGFVDTDADGTPDCIDGCPNNSTKLTAQVCGCDLPDNDADGDGTLDCNDTCPSDPLKTAPGACNCGTRDDDLNSNGTADCLDTTTPVIVPTETPGETPDDTTHEPDSTDDGNDIGTDTGNPEGNKSSGGGCSLNTSAQASPTALMLVVFVIGTIFCVSRRRYQ